MIKCMHLIIFNRGKISFLIENGSQKVQQQSFSFASYKNLLKLNKWIVNKENLNTIFLK
jgi:hypothetical protein